MTSVGVRRRGHLYKHSSPGTRREGQEMYRFFFSNLYFEERAANDVVGPW